MFKRIRDFFGQSRSNIFKPNDPQTKLIASRSKIPLYRKLSSDLIVNTADSDLDKLISGNIFVILQENRKQGNVFVNKKLSEGQRAFYVTRIIEGDISNGGIRQVMFNHPFEDLRKFSQAAFDRLKANEFSMIMSEALQLQTDGKSETHGSKGTLEQLADAYENDVFSALDKRFYQLNRVDSPSGNSRLDELRIRYVRENREEFI